MDNMVKTLCVVQARLTSSRLPDKVVMKLGKTGKTIAEHVFERLSLCRNIDKVVFAIPVGRNNDALESFLVEKGIPCFRGSEDNVLERFYNCIKTYEPEIVVRATSDNPFVDWQQVDAQIENLPGFDYVSSKDAPLGTGAEVFYAKGLYEAYLKASSDREREHVTPYLYLHPELFRVNRIPYHLSLSGVYRLTVDTDKDFELAQRVYDELYDGQAIPNQKVYQYLDAHPEVWQLNKDVEQKENDLIQRR
ncbi:spore coat polysaccharide biosynthesis protein SpsF [Xylanibacter ruminicola]|uniref:Spore coat polysaccharide biosynthesis protein SpsF n=2 Tax=Xylanibacter ruminicola TaxID=839 RepID=A0A1H5SFP2_XYLRU|nr:spore coat polysaccharide biosynthesis protein SpsF [Xylanibacter ruminicola]